MAELPKDKSLVCPAFYFVVNFDAEGNMWDRAFLSFGIRIAHTEHRKRKGGGVYDR
jgi:hypothetical protein